MASALIEHLQAPGVCYVTDIMLTILELPAPWACCCVSVSAMPAGLRLLLRE